MNKSLILILPFLILGCSRPEKLELPLKTDIHWTSSNQFSEYDIRYIQLNFDPFINEEIMGRGIEELMFKDSMYTLDLIDKNRLSKMISDSLNFSRGECGTFALNAGFVFIKNDTIRGIIEMGCGCYDWGFEPGSNFSQDGSLSDQGFEAMTIMLDSINYKMEIRGKDI